MISSLSSFITAEKNCPNRTYATTKQQHRKKVFFSLVEKKMAMEKFFNFNRCFDSFFAALKLEVKCFMYVQ
jgi:hypothetical protein